MVTPVAGTDTGVSEAEVVVVVVDDVVAVVEDILLTYDAIGFTKKKENRMTATSSISMHVATDWIDCACVL